MSVYPSVRSAIFSAICDYYGFDEADTDDALEATALTDKIVTALEQVEDAQVLDLWAPIAGGSMGE